jgi:broad specificity phosphatase PhoE
MNVLVLNSGSSSLKLPSSSREHRRAGDDALRSALPIFYLARHRETPWTLSGQHTGRADLPLTEHGERTGRRLGERLQRLTFAKVFTSPLQRVRQTCELAGCGPVAEIDPNLVECDYVKYDGRQGAEIRAQQPDWNLFRDGCSGCGTPQQVSARADRVVSRVRAIPGDFLLFTSGHLMRYWRHGGLGSNRQPTADISC